MKIYRKLMLAVVSLIGLAACAAQPKTLNVMVHDSFSISDSLISEFESAHDVQVNFLLGGDAGSMLNQVILTKSNPNADVLYGVDNSFLARALEEGIFSPYKSPLLSDIPAEFIVDKTYSALPVDYGDVCINYDKKYFQENGLSIPESFEDLTDPKYANLLVVENPATSSPGLSFLLATIAEYGEEGYLDYWKRLLDNDTFVVNDWETAYYSNFSAASGVGLQPMVVSYATSPAAEVYFSELELDETPTASILGPNMCFRQIEFVGILSGTENQNLARAFVDFMLSQKFQEDIPLNMFVLPVNRKAQLPEVFIDHIEIAENPAILSQNEIAENRERWINAWRDLVLN